MVGKSDYRIFFPYITYILVEIVVKHLPNHSYQCIWAIKENKG